MAFPNITPGAIFSNLSTLAGLLTSSLAIDVVAVYNQESFQQVFSDARPMGATIRKYARVMEYPVENGSVIADHKVVLPQTVEMTVLVSSGFYASTYTAIEELFKNSTLLTVQTKTSVMRNFIIEAMPHEEKPDMFDTISMSLRLKEVLLVQSPTIYAPADPQNQNTVSRGQIVTAPNPTPSTASNGVVVAGTRSTPATIIYERSTTPFNYRNKVVTDYSKPANISGK